MAEAPITVLDDRKVQFTVSIGACLVKQGETVDVVADMADAALYRAKAEGRNRVVVFDPVRQDVDQRRA